MNEDPSSLMGGSGSLSIPNSHSDLLCNENEFGVVQSPHQGSYMIGHNQRKTLMEPWEKSNIKPIELFATTHNLPEVPDVVVTQSPSEEGPSVQSSSPVSVPKMLQLDEHNDEMFQLDDDIDEFECGSLSAMKTRKMSRSIDFIAPLESEDSTMEGLSSKSRLQKFSSDSNLHTGESNMSLVERVTMLNLTATKKSPRSSQTPPLLRENSEEPTYEGENRLKKWFTKKSVTVSSREMNAIAPFPS